MESVSNCWERGGGKYGERVARNIAIFDFAYVDILDYSEAYDYFNYSNDAYVDYLVEYLGYRFFVSGPDCRKNADFGPSQTIQ